MNGSLKKPIGVLLIVLGFLALITPLTPGAWLIFIGLELFGIRLVAWDKLKDWWQGRKEEKTEEDKDTGAH